MRILSLAIMCALALAASNHREAPITALGSGDALVALVTYSGNRATLVVCADPALSPAKAATFDASRIYEAKLDDNGDSREEIAFRVRFLAAARRYEVRMVRGGVVTELHPAGGLETGAVQALGQGMKAYAGLAADPSQVSLVKMQATGDGVSVIAIEFPVDLLPHARSRRPAELEASVQVTAAAARANSASARAPR
ncbi:MAG: hypothetical protein U0Q16_19035 [Bryobacteraceae bacterium]